MCSSQLSGHSFGARCITWNFKASPTIAITPRTHLERSFEDLISTASPAFFTLLCLLTSSSKFPPRVVGLVAEPPSCPCANVVSPQPNSSFKETHSWCPERTQFLAYSLSVRPSEDNRPWILLCFFDVVGDHGQENHAPKEKVIFLDHGLFSFSQPIDSILSSSPSSDWARAIWLTRDLVVSQDATASAIWPPTMGWSLFSNAALIKAAYGPTSFERSRCEPLLMSIWRSLSSLLLPCTGKSEARVFTCKKVNHKSISLHSLSSIRRQTGPWSWFNC